MASQSNRDLETVTPVKPAKPREKRSAKPDSPIDEEMQDLGLGTPTSKSQRATPNLSLSLEDVGNLNSYGFAMMGSRSKKTVQRRKQVSRDFNESELEYLPGTSASSSTTLQRCWVGLSMNAEKIFLTISWPMGGTRTPTFKYYYYGKGTSASLGAVVEYNLELIQYGLWTGWLAPRWQELKHFGQSRDNNTPDDACLMAYAQWVQEGRPALGLAVGLNPTYPALS